MMHENSSCIKQTKQHAGNESGILYSLFQGGHWCFLIEARGLVIGTNLFCLAERAICRKNVCVRSGHVQDADSTDIYQISRNWKDLVKRARSKQLAPDEYNSGNFTISNLGMFGADTFDAILPPGKYKNLCFLPCKIF